MVLGGMYLLDQYGYRSVESITVFEFFILTLATLRLTRLVVYDRVSAFVRDQFHDTNLIGNMIKPKRGVRRTIADLLSCPWCFGMWSGAVVVFCFFFTPLAYYPVLFFAIAGAATLLQILGNWIGWSAERAKQDAE